MSRRLRFGADGPCVFLFGRLTGFVFDGAPAVVAVQVLHQSGAERHVTHVVQQHVEDRPRPPTDAGRRDHVAELAVKSASRSPDWTGLFLSIHFLKNPQKSSKFPVT